MGTGTHIALILNLAAGRLSAFGIFYPNVVTFVVDVKLFVKKIIASVPVSAILLSSYICRLCCLQYAHGGNNNHLSKSAVFSIFTLFHTTVCFIRSSSEDKHFAGLATANIPLQPLS